MRVARRFVVSGRVQGVGFRFFAADAARREGIHGTVHNRADGCVEIEAEGEAESMTRFERAVRQGPSRARIEYVQVEEALPLDTRTGFSIS